MSAAEDLRQALEEALVADPDDLAAHRAYAAKDFAGAVAEFVREYGITHVMLGRTQRPWYRRWFGQSPLDRLLRTVPGVDVIIVDTT